MVDYLKLVYDSKEGKRQAKNKIADAKDAVFASRAERGVKYADLKSDKDILQELARTVVNYENALDPSNLEIDPESDAYKAQIQRAIGKLDSMLKFQVHGGGIRGAIKAFKSGDGDSIITGIQKKLGDDYAKEMQVGLYNKNVDPSDYEGQMGLAKARSKAQEGYLGKVDPLENLMDLQDLTSGHADEILQANPDAKLEDLLAA